MKLYWSDIEDHEVVNPYTVSILSMKEIEAGKKHMHGETVHHLVFRFTQ